MNESPSSMADIYLVRTVVVTGEPFCLSAIYRFMFTLKYLPPTEPFVLCIRALHMCRARIFKLLRIPGIDSKE
jgi:hypothetical protein